MTILNLQPSCGCTSGKASTSTVNPGDSATIEAQMDTRNFLGLKSTILYVTLVTASGREAEVRLGVTSNILADIVLNPGAVDFGTVMKGQSASQTLTIDRIGAPGWRFERMVSASRVLTAQLTETRRDAKGSVSYTLNVGIKPDAPAGPVRDEIRLMSNDREAASIPIMVTGYIRGNLTAAPSLLTMGEVASTAGKQGRFILRASQPFAITSIEGAGDGFSIAPDDDARKTQHLVTMTYKPEEGRPAATCARVPRPHRPRGRTSSGPDGHAPRCALNPPPAASPARRGDCADRRQRSRYPAADGGPARRCAQGDGRCASKAAFASDSGTVRIGERTSPAAASGPDRTPGTVRSSLPLSAHHEIIHRCALLPRP